MKSHVCHMCVMAMLFLPTVTQSEIIRDGDWQPYLSSFPGSSIGGGTGYSGAYTMVNGTNNYSWAHGQGWESVLTTESGFYDWSYYIYTWAETHLFLWDNQYCYEVAYAMASAEFPLEHMSDSLAVDDDGYVVLDGAGVQGLHLNNEDDGGSPDGIYRSNQSYLTPDDGLSAEHVAITWAWVPEGGDNVGYVHACVCAMVNLYEVE